MAGLFDSFLGADSPFGGIYRMFNPEQQTATPAPEAAQPTAAAPQSPGFGGHLLAGLNGFIGNAHGGPLGAILGGVGGLATGKSPGDDATQALIARGFDPGLARTVARDPDMMRAVMPNLLLRNSRTLTAEQKTAMGLPANAPWMMGGDGKPFLPEGYATTLPQEVKDGAGNPMSWNRLTNTAAPIGGMGTPKPKFDDVASVRKEIGALPEVKRFSEAAPIYNSMLKSRGVNTSAADLDFVYGVAKIFDPDSVVREGEMKLVGSAQSLPEDVKALMGAVAMGKGRLSPEARDRILQIAQTRINELQSSYEGRVAPYTGIAQRNNINTADILPQLPTLTPWSMPQASTVNQDAVPEKRYNPKTRKYE